MKIGPIIRAIDDLPAEVNKITYRLVHTGQHYDEKLSRIFFDELEIPPPDINLGVGSGSQAEQTARIMIEFEKDLLHHPSDLVIVVGDVTSTMACTIVAKKLNTKVAHVEAGIRSFDLSMPEEINRIVTDSLADYFFTTSSIANENLIKAGVNSSQIFLVGNTMIDSMVSNLKKIRPPELIAKNGIEPQKFFVLTLHRPSNVDDPKNLELILNNVNTGARDFPVIFPVHPRTAEILKNSRWNFNKILTTEPLSYLQFLFLLKNCVAAITDSGGIQEETTYLGIPCITLRNNTERPETIDLGTNVLCADPAQVSTLMKSAVDSNWKNGSIPEFWDGKTAQRIVNTLLSF
jgi:UDP-N-acetylglucosamine 2-epimerase (non-hydrolysing)